MASPVSVGCRLSPELQEQRAKTFSKGAFKSSLLGATAYNVQSTDENHTADEDETAGQDKELCQNNEESSAREDENTATHSIPPPTKGSWTPLANVTSDGKIKSDVEDASPKAYRKDSPANISASPHCPSSTSKNSENNTVAKDLDAFDFNYDKVGTPGKSILEDEFHDTVSIFSPAQLSDKGINDCSDIDEDKLQNAVRFLIELDAENINLSTKSWMVEIAGHLGVDRIPKEWKSTIKNILLTEATTYTQSQVDSSPLGDVELDSDVEDNSSSADKDHSVNKITDQSPYSPESQETTLKNERKNVKSNKNEELEMEEKMNAELSERTMKMIEFIERDEEEVECKAEELRQKLRERKKKRIMQKISEATSRNSVQLKELKTLTKRLMDEGEYEHASLLLKDAVKIDITDDVESSEDEDSDESDENEDGCIALSDDDDDDDDEDVTSCDQNSKLSVQNAENKDTKHGGVKYNPFLKVKKTAENATAVPTNKWALAKEKFRQKVKENALTFQAKEVGCENVEVFSTILNVVEIGRAREAALKQEELHRQQEQKAIEEEARRERERKFRENMLKVQDDDSEGELDDEADIKKGVSLDTVLKTKGGGEYDVDVDASSSDDEDEEENEEEQLAKALQEEEDALERLKHQEEKEKLKEAHGFEKGNELQEASNHESAGVQDDALVDSDVETSSNSPKTKNPAAMKKSSKKESKSLSYLEMVKLEEQQLRRNKGYGGFLDDEAEEEEEEGGQAGLGNFGFSFTKKEQDEEAEALKLRKGDLSHIVNDEDADSGDEDEARRRRIEADEKEEKQRMKDIVTGLAKGHTGRKEDALGRHASGLYGQDNLAQEGIYAKEQEDSEEKTVPDAEAEVDDDDERVMMESMLNQMASRQRQAGQTDDVEELTDDSDDDEEDEALAEMPEMTVEERKYYYEQKQLKKKQESENYKRFYDQALRKRALRRQKQKDESSEQINISTSSSLPLLTLTSSSPTNESGLTRVGTHPSSNVEVQREARPDNLDSHSFNPAPISSMSSGQSKIKRRTSLPPRKVEGKVTRPRAPKRHKSHDSCTGESNSSPRALNSHSKDILSGVLDQSQLDAGYGLGMCVSKERRMASSDSNSRIGKLSTTATGGGPAGAGQPYATGTSNSLFAAVTGKKAGEPPALTRSFSGVLARSKTMNHISSGKAPSTGGRGVVTVSSQQFVFKEESQSNHLQEGGDSHSAWGKESSRHVDDSRSRISNTDSKKRNGTFSADTNSSIKRAKSFGGLSKSVIGKNDSQNNSSLFSKIGKNAGPVRASTAVSASASHSQRFRPSSSVRMKLASFTRSSLTMK